MIKKVKINCDYCKDDKDCFAFRFQAHVCESCLNENGIMSISNEEKKIMVNNIRYNLSYNPNAENTIKLLERIKNVKAE